MKTVAIEVKDKLGKHNQETLIAPDPATRDALLFGDIQDIIEGEGTAFDKAKDIFSLFLEERERLRK